VLKIAILVGEGLTLIRFVRLGSIPAIATNYGDSHLAKWRDIFEYGGSNPHIVAKFKNYGKNKNAKLGKVLK